jgi:putative tricarboxylic transport membrane protein
MADESLRRALMISDGSFLPMLQRPVCLILVLFILYFLLSQFGPVKRCTQRLFSRFKPAVGG